MSMQSHGSVSQRGLLSISMLMFSVGGLGIAMLAGAKLVYDILDVGLVAALDGLVIKVIVVGLAYIVGWVAGMLAIRVYGNLVLPFVINLFIWIFLIGICALYLLILQRLWNQEYDIVRYMAYVAIMASAGAAMIGLHLILEDHDLRPLSIPLLIILFIQLGLIVLRYVFTPDARPSYLINDLVFFAGMAIFALFMLAHVGILAPVRRRITNYFDRNSRAIRTQN
ncbi:MAG: hypothetical protein ACM3XO_01105 [Bacteroidota bacterium]